MIRVKVTCEVRTYDEPAKPDIKVHSHWNDSGKIVIEIGDETITVVSNDLITAIKNCSNTGGSL